MCRTPLTRTASLLALALMTASLSSGQAGRAGTAPPPGAPLRARIIGAPLPGAAATVAPAGRAAGLPSKKDQIKVLTAALKRMHENYAKFRNASPGPMDIFDYRIGPLWRKGIDGAGTTIAVLEGWSNPKIASKVAGFDHLFGLPDPHIQTIYPSDHHKLPATCPPGMVKLGRYGSCNAWKGELTLDVIAAHLIAPYAKILISVTPADSEITDDPASNVAPPEMMQAVEYISSHHLANVISASTGTGEITYGSGAQIAAQTPGELAAAAAGIPLLVITGDCGVVQNLADARYQCEDTSPAPDTAAWDDSPWVTAVGGSVPNLSSSGNKIGPDPLWNGGGIFSEGAGYSSVFTRPAYQKAVAHITGSRMRSVPDITMDAQDGTSEAAPMLAGVLALATQLNHGRNVGPINPVLYRVLGPRGARAGLADVISGNNSLIILKHVLVRGFTAAKGFDVASGWGTINAARFVPSLAAATRANHQDAAARRQAQAELNALRHGIHLSATSVPPGGSSYLLAAGYLPHHPVRLSIDGRAIATLTANSLGAVTYMIDPSLLKLTPGQHLIRLTGMLLTQSTSFHCG